MLTPDEVPPPGLGVVTVTESGPAFRSVGEGNVAVSWEELTKFVASGVPLACTTDCVAKPEPRTAKVVSLLPASIVGGATEVITGMGLTMVTEADPDRDESATLTALIVTVLGEGGATGAV